MEVIVGIAFVALVAFIGFMKFRRVSSGKDCCKK